MGATVFRHRRPWTQRGGVAQYPFWASRDDRGRPAGDDLYQRTGRPAIAPATAFRRLPGGTAFARTRRTWRPSTAGLRLGMESFRPHGGESNRLWAGRNAPPFQLQRQTVA